MLKTVAIAYVAAGLWMAVVDSIWLSTMISVYRQHIGALLMDGVRFGPAIVFYLLYVAGIVYFAILPAVNSGGGWQQAALNGALLGLVAYGTYDLTNQATMKVWPTAMTVMDMAWGTVLTASAAAVGAAVTGWFNNA